METIEQNETLSLCRRVRGLLLPLIFALVLPPVCSLILGYEWIGQMINHVPTAIVDHDNSSLSRQLISCMENNQAFDIQHYSSNDEDIEKWIFESKIGAGVIIPEDFMNDIMNGRESKVLVVYDGSQMGMTGAVKTRISEIMATIRAGFLMRVMEGKLNMTPAEAEHYIQPVAYTTRLLGNPAKSSASFTIPGMVLNICQIAVFCLGVEVGDAIRRSSNQFRRYLLGILACGGVGVFTAFNSLLIQVKVFDSPFRGAVLPALTLVALNMLFIAGFGVLVVIINKRKLGSLMLSTIVLATVLLSGYSYPTIAMPHIFQVIAPLVHFTHCVIPMRDIALLGVSFKQIMPHIYWLSGYVAIELMLIFTVNQLGKSPAVSAAVNLAKGKAGGINNNA